MKTNSKTKTNCWNSMKMKKTNWNYYSTNCSMTSSKMTRTNFRCWMTNCLSWKNCLNWMMRNSNSMTRTKRNYCCLMTMTKEKNLRNSKSCLSSMSCLSVKNSTKKNLSYSIATNSNWMNSNLRTKMKNCCSNLTKTKKKKSSNSMNCWKTMMKNSGYWTNWNLNYLTTGLKMRKSSNWTNCANLNLNSKKTMTIWNYCLNLMNLMNCSNSKTKNYSMKTCLMSSNLKKTNLMSCLTILSLTMMKKNYSNLMTRNLKNCLKMNSERKNLMSCWMTNYGCCSKMKNWMRSLLKNWNLTKTGSMNCCLKKSLKKTGWSWNYSMMRTGLKNLRTMNCSGWNSKKKRILNCCSKTNWKMTNSNSNCWMTSLMTKKNSTKMNGCLNCLKMNSNLMKNLNCCLSLKKTNLTKKMSWFPPNPQNKGHTLTPSRMCRYYWNTQNFHQHIHCYPAP